MNIRHLITLAALACATDAAVAQRAQRQELAAPLRPKLILCILVDNLTPQQLQIAEPNLGKDGLKRLMQGTRVEDAYYDAGGNYAGKNLSSLFTGAPACTHGIVAEQWIDNFYNKRIHAIYGDAYTLQGEKLDTMATPSNQELICGTIGNEIRKLYNSKAKIYSVGLNPEDLMWASGTRIAEPVVCFDLKTGEMAPRNITAENTLAWIENFNNQKMADKYLERIWAPKLDIMNYHSMRFFQAEDKHDFYYGLKPTPGTPPRQKYSRLKGSPFANTLVRDFTTSLILMEELGKDDVPDLLTVEFTATPSVRPKQQPLDPESEDLILCLDDNIATLLRAIDENVGMDNVLVIFTAAQGQLDLQTTKSEHWSNAGVVSLHRATALLNLYLMALHGQGRWVLNYSPGAIYMDKELAKERGVNQDTLLQEAAEFLTQVKGIENAIVGRRLHSYYSEEPIIRMLRRNYHPKRSGDILIYLQPGWAEEMDDGRQIQQQWAEERVPLLFYGWKVPHQIIYTPQNMTNVAPTIAEFMGIARPNASSGEIIGILK